MPDTEKPGEGEPTPDTQPTAEEPSGNDPVEVPEPSLILNAEPEAESKEIRDNDPGVFTKGD